MLLRRGIISSGLSGDTFVGWGDVVSGLAVGFSKGRIFSGQGTNNAEIRVIAASSDIGYENNKFSQTDWNTATTNGANTAFLSKWYDQVASNNAVQATTTKQAETTIDGIHIFDGGNDNAISNYSMPQGDNFSMLIALDHPTAENSIAAAMDDGTNRSWNFTTRTDDRIELPVWKSSVKSGVFCNTTAWAGQGKTVFICAYDSAVGWTVQQDGSTQTVTTNTTGTVDTGPSGLALGSRGDGQQFYDGSIMDFGFWPKTLTSQEKTDIYTQWAINDAL